MKITKMWVQEVALCLFISSVCCIPIAVNNTKNVNTYLNNVTSMSQKELKTLSWNPSTARATSLPLHSTVNVTEKTRDLITKDYSKYHSTKKLVRRLKQGNSTFNTSLDIKSIGEDKQKTTSSSKIIPITRKSTNAGRSNIVPVTHRTAPSTINQSRAFGDSTETVTATVNLTASSRNSSAKVLTEDGKSTVEPTTFLQDKSSTPRSIQANKLNFTRRNSSRIKTAGEMMTTKYFGISKSNMETTVTPRTTEKQMAPSSTKSPASMQNMGETGKPLTTSLQNNVSTTIVLSKTTTLKLKSKTPSYISAPNNKLLSTFSPVAITDSTPIPIDETATSFSSTELFQTTDIIKSDITGIGARITAVTDIMTEPKDISDTAIPKTTGSPQVTTIATSTTNTTTESNNITSSMTISNVKTYNIIKTMNKNINDTTKHTKPFSTIFISATPTNSTKSTTNTTMSVRSHGNDTLDKKTDAPDSKIAKTKISTRKVNTKITSVLNKIMNRTRTYPSFKSESKFVLQLNFTTTPMSPVNTIKTTANLTIPRKTITDLKQTKIESSFEKTFSAKQGTTGMPILPAITKTEPSRVTGKRRTTMEKARRTGEADLIVTPEVIVMPKATPFFGRHSIKMEEGTRIPTTKKKKVSKIESVYSTPITQNHHNTTTPKAIVVINNNKDSVSNDTALAVETNGPQGFTATSAVETPSTVEHTTEFYVFTDTSTNTGYEEHSMSLIDTVTKPVTEVPGSTNSTDQPAIVNNSSRRLSTTPNAYTLAKTATEKMYSKDTKVEKSVVGSDENGNVSSSKDDTAIKDKTQPAYLLKTTASPVTKLSMLEMRSSESKNSTENIAPTNKVEVSTKFKERNETEIIAVHVKSNKSDIGDIVNTTLKSKLSASGETTLKSETKSIQNATSIQRDTTTTKQHTTFTTNAKRESPVMPDTTIKLSTEIPLSTRRPQTKSMGKMNISSNGVIFTTNLLETSTKTEPIPKVVQKLPPNVHRVVIVVDELPKKPTISPHSVVQKTLRPASVDKSTETSTDMSDTPINTVADERTITITQESTAYRDSTFETQISDITNSPKTSETTEGGFETKTSVAPEATQVNPSTLERNQVTTVMPEESKSDTIPSTSDSQISTFKKASKAESVTVSKTKVATPSTPRDFKVETTAVPDILSVQTTVATKKSQSEENGTNIAISSIESNVGRTTQPVITYTKAPSSPEAVKTLITAAIAETFARVTTSSKNETIMTAMTTPQKIKTVAMVSLKNPTKQTHSVPQKAGKQDSKKETEKEDVLIQPSTTSVQVTKSRNGSQTETIIPPKLTEAKSPGNQTVELETTGILITPSPQNRLAPNTTGKGIIKSEEYTSNQSATSGAQETTTLLRSKTTNMISKKPPYLKKTSPMETTAAPTTSARLVSKATQKNVNRILWYKDRKGAKHMFIFLR